ncbi:alpha/beta fold hydrolase [Candidatus Curtissbacteria bacterium]|nr:alpha/beta fold hydrolase [Candidatus Curtissbacteria bacterium]
MFREKRTFKNSKGLVLSAVFEGDDKKAPTVVICHGYASSKDSESQQDLSKRLLAAGFSVYRFDFTGCGESEGSLSDLTPKNGLDDLKSAVKNLNIEKFAIHGSSFGGYTALLYASENPPLALTLKAPVSDYPAVLSADEDEERPSRDKILKETSNLDIYQKAKNVKCNVLIVHGDADEVVPLKQSKDLLESLGSKTKKLDIIKDAPHTMRGRHMHQAHQRIADFLKELFF